MEKDDTEDFCIAVAKVPKEYPTESLSKLIEERSNIGVVKATTVPGAENDQHLERLVVKLRTKEAVKRLCQDVKEEVIDHNGENYTILFEKCTKCEIPLEWQTMEAAVDQAPESSTSATPNSDQPPSSHGPKPGNMGHDSMQGDGQRTFYQNYPAHPGFAFGFPMQHGMRFPFTQAQQHQGGIPLTQEQQQAMYAQMLRMQFSHPQPQFQGQPAKPREPPPPYNSGGNQGYFPERPQGEDVTYVKQGPVPDKATLDQENVLQRLQEKGQKEAEYRTPENLDNRQTDDSTATPEESDERDNVEKTNKLILKDLPSEAHRDFLQLYFEQKKLGGHTVSSVEVDEELAMSLIEFSTSEAVEDILSRTPITISGQQIRAKAYFEVEEVQELCTVTVDGLHDVDTETIEMYFENEKRSGGDEIVKIDLDEDGTVAYITFSSEAVARRVVERENHILRGKHLEVTLWQPPKQSWNVPSPEPEQETEPLPADTIQIHGLDDTIDEQMLEMYFENTKRSGGDDIKDLKIHDNLAYITYMSEEVAQRVIDRGPHFLKGLELTVSMWEPTRDDATTREPNDSQEPECTIEVTGIDTSIDKDTLALYFENTKRSGGDFIQELDIDYHNRRAFITFQDAEVAQRVADRENHSLGKKNLQVKLCRRSFDIPDAEAITPPLCTVEVQGVSPSIEEETLTMYFENERRSGGGTVLNTKLDKSTGTAYIEFESEEVAKRVAKKDGHMLNKKPLNVAIHTPHKPKPAKRRSLAMSERSRTDKTKESSEENEEQQPTSVVKVKGLTRIKSHDTMQYYFENHRRSSGGDIIDITYHEEDDDIVFITFCDPQENVASRSHEIEGQSLQVSLHVPPKPRPFYKDKVLIKGLQSTTTKECLFNFLEAKLGSVPVERQIGEKQGVVLVTFDDQPDFEKLSKICANFPLEGATLQVSQVQVSNCIIVFNFPNNTTKDTIWFYFENTRKSDGGPVDKVVMKEEECYCLVYFVDYSVVDKVLVKKHVVGDNVLNVKLYLECLGCSTDDIIETPVQLPDAFVIHDVEPSKLKFMRQSKTNCEAITRQMSDVYAGITWPGKDCKAKDVLINCTLTPQTASVRKLVKSWKETALQNFEDFMRNIVVAKHDVHQELWERVMEKIRSLQITNPDAAALLADKEQGIISVVGLRQTVEVVSRDILDCIKQVEDETEKEKLKVKETLTSLKLIETKMLLAQKFPGKMEAKFPSLKVKINQNKNEISFDGPAGNVTAAKMEMFETKDTYAKASVDMIGCRSFFSLYETKQAKDYIVKKLKNNHVTAVWEVKDQTLTVCSTCEENAKKSLELIKNCVVENKISLTAENLDLLKTDNWQSMLDEQKQKYPGKIEFEAQQKVACVCSTDDIVDEVLGAVKRCLRKNTIIEDEVDFGKNINRLIEKDHKDEIASIGKKYASLNTQINFKRNNSGFILRGTKEGVDELKRELHTLRGKVKHKLHTIKSPGIDSHMTSSKGKEHINRVEEKHHVVIDSSPDRDDDDDDDDDDPYYQNASSMSKSFSDIGPRIHAECTAYDVKKIYTAEGDMTELPVDVLVNTADSKLSLTGGLSKAISTKGGIEIRNACQSYIRDEGELGEGEAFLSPAGNLGAKYVVHIVGPTWKGGANNEEVVLDESVLKSIKKASDKRVKSVALPAISCGVYSFPVKRATRIIAKAVKNFFREVQDSTITEVYLCDVKSSTVESFTEALIEVFGDRNVTKLPHKQPSARPKATPRKSRPKVQPADDSSDDDPYEYLDKYQDRGNQQNVMFGGISVRIVKGEIAKESVEVIVNTTARNLDLKNGAVSASLLRTAGNQLQVEIHQKYPNGIKDDEIAVTSGKGLKCQMVIHTSLMNWDNNVAKKALHTLMNNCLNEADSKGYSSIAFPAIGTGNLGFPRDVVAKEMFTVIYNFARANPKSSINDVRFIVYQKDVGTISAFEAEEKTRLSGKGASGYRQLQQTQSASSMFKDVSPDESDSDKSGSYEEIDDDDDDVTKALAIIVEKGDITKVECDCIVNSSNDQLDLSKGAVSQALVKAGGAKLTEECKKKARGMKTDGIVMTGAPGLPFKHIIHVVAQDSISAWKKMVNKCFKMAEAQQLKSIAFPALGTNIQGNTAEIAETMVLSLREFEAKPHHHLQKVHFIIFQSHMVEIFRKAVEKVKVPGSTTKLSLKSSLQTKKKKRKSVKVDNRDRFRIRIYSLSMKNIDEAIDCLETIIRNEIKREVFDEPTLGNLPDQKRKDILALSKRFNVEIRFTSRTKLEVIGMIQSVMDATNRIHGWLREVERNEYEKKEAMQLAQIVQWFFIEITDQKQELLPYDPSVNLLIENAFKSGKQHVEFNDNEGTKYIIDFQKMEEYADGQPEDAVNVIRRDRMKEGSFNIPKNWTDMGKDNVKVITLLNTDKEYLDVVAAFTKSVNSPNFEVTRVDRIQNRTLWMQYHAKKKLLDDTNGKTINERILWHGTSVDTVDSINANGFNRSYCGKNATAFGDGVYFAVSASYSCSDTYSRPDSTGIKRMYMCQVLTGEYTMGKGGMRVPPPKTGGAASSLYDSVVNNKDSPSMFIIFHDTQAYPKYLIQFKKKA